jgi:hypothetical protein
MIINTNKHWLNENNNNHKWVLSTNFGVKNAVFKFKEPKSLNCKTKSAMLKLVWSHFYNWG